VIIIGKKKNKNCSTTWKNLEEKTRNCHDAMPCTSTKCTIITSTHKTLIHTTPSTHEIPPFCTCHTPPHPVMSPSRLRVCLAAFVVVTLTIMSMIIAAAQASPLASKSSKAAASSLEPKQHTPSSSTDDCAAIRSKVTSAQAGAEELHAMIKASRDSVSNFATCVVSKSDNLKKESECKLFMDSIYHFAEPYVLDPHYTTSTAIEIVQDVARRQGSGSSDDSNTGSQSQSLSATWKKCSVKKPRHEIGNLDKPIDSSQVYFKITVDRTPPLPFDIGSTTATSSQTILAQTRCEHGVVTTPSALHLSSISSARARAYGAVAFAEYYPQDGLSCELFSTGHRQYVVEGQLYDCSASVHIHRIPGFPPHLVVKSGSDSESVTSNCPYEFVAGDGNDHTQGMLHVHIRMRRDVVDKSKTTYSNPKSSTSSSSPKGPQAPSAFEQSKGLNAGFSPAPVVSK
jgi:hypothetical protein